jgi:L-arabinose transport system ATP-binding protein
MTETTSTLEIRGISKAFPGVQALDAIGFEAAGGEVVALLGENGAGKSTLLKILSGDYRADGGVILLDGEELSFSSPRDAIRAGIGIIYQERQIVLNLSVAENVFMGNLPVNALGTVDFRRLNAETQRLLDEFHLPIGPTDKVKNLSVAYQQMVEIMKAYARKLRVIAFDEPTASLSDEEIGSLFAIIESLKAKGIVILYVSHRLKELPRIADRVVVLKDGRFVATKRMDETDEIELVRLMVGRELGSVFGELDRKGDIGETILSVSGLGNASIHDVSFELRKGEILGLAGLVGAGRTEVVRAIFGADPVETGEIRLDGKRVSINSPERAIDLGIGLCPEDRKLQGIVPKRSIRDNISMVVLRRLTRFGFVPRKTEASLVEDGIRALRIRTPNADKHIAELSGGNQQKAILARWLAMEPRILILDEPTKGIDVGAKSEIYRIIYDLAAKGLGLIVISSELTELIGLCDRILVMRNGSIAGTLDQEEATEDSILCLAMLGHKGRTNGEN